MTNEMWEILRKWMKKEREDFLMNAHTSECEVIKINKGQYFFIDGNIAWIPEYLYLVKKFKKYKERGIRE